MKISEVQNFSIYMSNGSAKIMWTVFWEKCNAHKTIFGGNLGIGHNVLSASMVKYIEDTKVHVDSKTVGYKNK